jgi:chromosome segregation ATPase
MYNNKYDILGSTIKPNPASVKYWADLASNPNGGDLKYFNGKDWVYVNNTATSDIKDLRSDLTSEISRATGRENEIEAKIDALIGDAPEIMDSLPELIDVINNHAELIEGKVDRQPGKGLSTNDYTTEEKNKLASLTNYSDSEVRELITALTLKVNSLEERVAALETPAA